MKIYPLVACLLSITVVQPPQERFGTQFAFVVDVSGSMDGVKLQRAIEGYAEVAEQSTDHMSMALWAFDTGVKRWPEGWVKLPDQTAITRAMAWLNEQAEHSGTYAGPALRAALADEKASTVVLITDGMFFSETDATVLAALESAQALRVKRGWGRATVAVIHVSAGETPPKALVQLAAAGRGGLFQVR